MHYGSKAFSKNGKDTITAKNGNSIGQIQKLSAIDVAQAKTMYSACKCGSTRGGEGDGSTGTLKYMSRVYQKKFRVALSIVK